MKSFQITVMLTDFEHEMLLKKYGENAAIQGFIHRSIDKTLAKEANEIDWDERYDKEESA